MKKMLMVLLLATMPYGSSGKATTATAGVPVLLYKATSDNFVDGMKVINPNAAVNVSIYFNNQLLALIPIAANRTIPNVLGSSITHIQNNDSITVSSDISGVTAEIYYSQYPVPVSGGASWGGIGGTLTAQTDLVTALLNDTTGIGTKIKGDTIGYGTNFANWNTAYGWGNWASGIYAWAKAATKPTYTYTEVGADVSGAAAAITLSGLGGVPTTRTINGYDLSANRSLTYTDVGASASGHNHSGVYEPVLGNPGTSGYVLSSTTGGTRSWIAPGIASYPGAGVVVSTGSAWGTSLTAPTYIMNNPLTTIGDLLYASSTATPATPSRLVAVAAGSVLISAGTATAPVWSTAPLASYRQLFEGSCSIIAAQAAGTYMLSNGSAGVVSGGSVLYPICFYYIAGADFPSVSTVTTKLRIRASVAVNATAPAANFTIGLYPVTSGAGAAGLKIWTTGTLVSGSATSTVTTPAGSSCTNVNGSDFVIPTDGIYCIAVVTSAAIATSSLVQIYGFCQLRNQ